MSEIHSGFKSIFLGLFQIWKGSKDTVIKVLKAIYSLAPGIGAVMIGNYFGVSIPEYATYLAIRIVEGVM